MPNSKALSDYIEIWGIENDTVLFSDGSLGFALELSTVDPSCWSDDKCNEFSGQLRQFLNGLPSELWVQFVQDMKSGNSAQLTKHHNAEDTDRCSISDSLAQDRISRFNTLDSQGQIPKFSLLLIVRKKCNKSLISKIRLFQKPTEFAEISETSLLNEIGILQQIKHDIQLSLSAIDIESRLVKSEALVNLIYQQWNPSRNVSLEYFDPEDIRENLSFTDVGISMCGFSLGDYQYRVISLKNLPDNTYSTMATKLGDLPFDSRLCVNIFSPDQQKEIEKLKLQRRVAYSMVSGQRGVKDVESQAKYNDLEALLEELVSQGEKVFHMGVQVLLRAKSESELSFQVNQTLLTLRELAGSEGMEETLAAFDIFASMAIPNARVSERSKRVKSSNLCDFLPVFGPWGGHPVPRILLRSRLGSLVGVDPFSPTLTNSNQIVSGGSGSGKSFMTNLLLMQMLKDDPRVFILDIGGSYKKICEVFDGQYIQLGVESDLSINPFDLPSESSSPSNSKIKFLLGLIELMTKEHDAQKLGKLEQAEAESAIEELYESKEPHTLSTLRSILASHNDPEMRRISRILQIWCGNSPYGKLLDQPTTLKLERSIVCFDLKGMESYPDLQAALLFVITDFVWREVQQDRNRIKFLVLDECWKLLENETASLFIAETFRTFRKYMASAIAISQNIDDFAKSKVSTAILPNSSIKWILKQKGADKDRLKDVLSLNHNELALISSLRQERGKFSEALLLAEDNRSLVSVEATPLEYWIATSDARDLAKIDEIKAQDPGLQLIDILRHLSTQFPLGIAASGG